MDTLSKAEYATVVVTGMISATLSILGSLVIVRVAVLRLRRTGSRDSVAAPTMQRLVLALGICDVVASIPWLLGEFLVPSSLDNRPWALGNLTTCTFVGVTSVYGTTGASLANLFLATYFFRQVQNKGKERIDDFYRIRERSWLLLIFLWPLWIVVTGLVIQDFGVIGKGGCWAGGDYPVGCDNVDVPCIRGGPEEPWLYKAAIGTVLVCMIFASIETILIWRQYREMIQQSNRHAFSRELVPANDLLLRQVAIQAILFFLIYFNMFLGWALASVVAYLEIDNLFLLAWAGYLLMPLQGFLNCIVYLRPSYRRWKEVEVDLSFAQTVWRCIQADTPSQHELNTSKASGRPDICVDQSVEASAPQSMPRLSSRSIAEPSDMSLQMNEDEEAMQDSTTNNVGAETKAAEIASDEAKEEDTMMDEATILAERSKKTRRSTGFRKSALENALPIVSEATEEDAGQNDDSSFVRNEKNNNVHRSTRRESGVFAWLEQSMSFNFLQPSSRSLDGDNNHNNNDPTRTRTTTTTTPVSHMSLHESRILMEEEHGEAFKSSFF